MKRSASGGSRDLATKPVPLRLNRPTKKYIEGIDFDVDGFYPTIVTGGAYSAIRFSPDALGDHLTDFGQAHLAGWALLLFRHVIGCLTIVFHFSGAARRISLR